MGAIDQLIDRIGEHAVELCMRAADLTVQRTQDAASSRSGDLRAGISHDQPVLNDTWVTCTITSEEPYSAAQDTGSGIYGPTGERIRSLSGGPLAFVFPGAATVITAKNPRGLSFFMSVAGSPGTHFFTEPMPERWHEALAESLGP